ncbi:MAG: beta-glucanase, partial [Cyanobacteria bacterium P01_D01_bin.50]
MSKIRIEAEDYRSGKNGETYYDTDAGNKTGKYRDDDVDILETKDIGGGYNIWGKKGEWTTYELEIPQTGVYDVVVRVASG